MLSMDSVITLELGRRSACFIAAGKPVSDPLPLGVELLAERWLRHDPPQPQELEAAIEAVEDLVMPLHGRWPATGTLRVLPQDDAFAQLAPLADAATREQLESLFQRAVAISEGRPRSSDPQLADPLVMAGLVVLREVMHHLGFTRLQLERG